MTTYAERVEEKRRLADEYARQLAERAAAPEVDYFAELRAMAAAPGCMWHRGWPELAGFVPDGVDDCAWCRAVLGLSVNPGRR